MLSINDRLGNPMDLNSVFEAVGAYSVGKCSDEELNITRITPVRGAVPVPVCLPPTP